MQANRARGNSVCSASCDAVVAIPSATTGLGYWLVSFLRLALCSAPSRLSSLSCRCRICYCERLHFASAYERFHRQRCTRGTSQKISTATRVAACGLADIFSNSKLQSRRQSLSLSKLFKSHQYEFTVFLATITKRVESKARGELYISSNSQFVYR